MKVSAKKRVQYRLQLKRQYTAYYEMYCKAGKKEHRTKFRDIKAKLDELRREDIER